MGKLTVTLLSQQPFDRYRGFSPVAHPASARDVRRLWEERLSQVPPGHPIWLYLHVPYCPQTCAYCHCGQQLLTDKKDLDTWVDRICAEIEFFAPVLSRTRVQQQYFGGGTPNLLADEQLDKVLTTLETHVSYDPSGRKTMEMLPSAYRPGALKVAARHGIRRLSCGVQSTVTSVLGKVARKPDFGPLEPLMREAWERGVVDINLDLAWGFKGDSEAVLFRSLADVLTLNPTTVTVSLNARPIFARLKQRQGYLSLTTRTR